MALATSAHHAIETVNIQTSRFNMNCPSPIHEKGSLRLDSDEDLTEPQKKPAIHTTAERKPAHERLVAGYRALNATFSQRKSWRKVPAPAQDPAR